MKTIIDFCFAHWGLILGVALYIVMLLIIILYIVRRAPKDTDLWGPEAYLFDVQPDRLAEIRKRHPELAKAIADYKSNRPWSLTIPDKIAGAENTTSREQLEKTDDQLMSKSLHE